MSPTLPICWTTSPSLAHAARRRALPTSLCSSSPSPAPSRSSAWRPTLTDVARLSRGQAAKSRGTGSRAVPHRLNADESAAFDRAQRHQFLTVRGASGARRERKGAPLANTWRMWCDARRRAAPVLHLAAANAPDARDCVVLDLATMRREGPAWADGGGGPQGIADAVRAHVREQVGPVYNEEDEGFERQDMEDVDWLKDPTWRLPDIAMVWECSDRTQAKAVAKAVATCPVTSCT